MGAGFGDVVEQAACKILGIRANTSLLIPFFPTACFCALRMTDQFHPSDQPSRQSPPREMVYSLPSLPCWTSVLLNTECGLFLFPTPHLSSRYVPCSEKHASRTTREVNALLFGSTADPFSSLFCSRAPGFLFGGGGLVWGKSLRGNKKTRA